jgi:hypothetical protein
MPHLMHMQPPPQPVRYALRSLHNMPLAAAGYTCTAQ